MKFTKTAIELEPFETRDLQGAQVTPIKIGLQNTNFAEFSCAGQTPARKGSGGKRATPLDVDLSFADGKQVAKGGWAKITMRVDCPLLKFNTAQPVFTAADKYSAKYLFMGDVSADALEASFYVHNKKTDKKPFTFNIAMVLGDASWQMPIFIDPKVSGGDDDPPSPPSPPSPPPPPPPPGG